MLNTQCRILQAGTGWDGAVAAGTAVGGRPGGRRRYTAAVDGNACRQLACWRLVQPPFGAQACAAVAPGLGSLAPASDRVTSQYQLALVARFWGGSRARLRICMRELTAPPADIRCQCRLYMGAI